jgi:tetratricopeptide (TPR) repeat protein
MSMQMSDRALFQTVIEEWTALEPGNTVAWLHSAMGAAALELPEQSLEAFMTLTELQPREAGNWFGAGQMLYALERYDEALVAFTKAANLDPKRTDAIYNCACIHCIQGDVVKALETLKRAIDLEPSFKEYARTDEDFECLRNNQEFVNLLKDHN